MTQSTYRRIMREVDWEADNDDFRANAQELGQRAQKALTREKRSQITGLESVANSTQKVSDVFNYIKLRTARQSEWRSHNFGQDLLEYLETTLSQKRDNVVRAVSKHTSLDKYQQQEVYILLIRAFVAQLAAQYEYACLQAGGTL